MNGQRRQQSVRKEFISGHAVQGREGNGPSNRRPQSTEQVGDLSNYM